MPKIKIAVPEKVSNSSLISLGMIICTVVLVMSFLFSRQLLGAIKFNNKVIGRKNAVKTTLENNVNSLGDLKNNYDLLSSQGPKPSAILRALPLRADYQKLADQFETMANLAGARLVAITLSSTPDGGVAPTAPATSGVQEVQFQVTAIGSYTALRKLTNNIEIADRPIKLVSVKFSGSEPSVTGAFNLTTFYQGKSDPTPLMETIQ